MTARFVPSYSTDLADAYRLKGAVGDGSTDDTTAVTTAAATAATQGTFVFLPGGTYSMPATAATALDGPFTGNGQLKTSDGNKRGKIFNAVKTQPSTLAWPGTGVADAFNGDLSHVPIVLEHRVTGTDTLGSAGQVSGTYFQAAEAGPFLGYMANSSGRSGAGSSGRTGAWFFNVRLKQESSAGGDLAALCVAGVAAGVTGGATRWDQNSSVGAIAGAMIGGADGVYLDADEITVRDGVGGTTYDVAGVGLIRNFIRTKDTASIGQWWGGVRLQSTGDATHGNVDVGFMAYGTTSGYMVGLDLAAANLTASGTYNNAAVTLAGDQRIYFNAVGTPDAGAGGFYRRPSSTGTEWIDYHPATSSFRVVVGSSTALQVSATQVTIPNNLLVSGAVAGALSMGSHQITNLTAGTSGTSTAASMLNSLDQFAAPVANVSWNSQRITSLHRGTANGQAVTWEQFYGAPSGGMLDLLFPGLVDLQVWGPTASDTWTRPATGKVAVIIALGPGGGGGGGVGGANSLFGGAGGGSGDVMVAYLPYAALPSSATVQVGGGGAGGAGSSTTTGNAGSNGSRSTIFDTGNNTLVAPAGGGGGAGGTSQGAAGAAGAAGTATTYTGYTIASVESSGSPGGQSSITTNAGGSPGGGAGGAGAGITSGGAVAGTGGVNGAVAITFAATASAPTSPAGQAGAVLGNAPFNFGTSVRFGGGGGGAKTSGTSGDGGAGYNAGGGGGGGSNKAGGTGGSGGNGGDGRLIVAVFG